MRMAGEDFQMLNLTLFAVIIISTTIDLTAGDLLVFHGMTDVTERVLVNESDAYLPVFNDTFLPNAVQGSSVGKPTALKVSLNYERHYSTIDQGATFEWASPQSGTSLSNLKGFYVEIDGKTSPSRYKLFILNNTEFRTQSLTFRMIMNSFSTITDDFIVRVYSMPADERYRSNTGAFEYLYLRTKIPTDNTYSYPNEWSPSIAYKPLLDSKSVDVYFSLPPKQRGWLLTQFNATLLSCPDREREKEHFVTKAKDTTETEAFFSFTEVEPGGSYSIMVEVNNYNKSLCICRTKSDECELTCGFTQTMEFALPHSGHLIEPLFSSGCELNRTTETYTSKPSSTQGSKGTPDVTSRNASSEGDDSKTVVIIIATLGLLIVMVLVILVISRYYYFRKGHDNHQPTENFVFPEREIDGIPLEEKVKELQRKTVYIVAASDNAEVDDLIKSFCAFLKAHCQCDVINPSDAILHQTHENVENEMRWVTSNMGRSDCIIFVNSRGAATLLNIYLKKEESGLDPSQSMALKALKISFSPLRSKFIIVTFNEDWIKDQLAILNPKKYFLPKQLPHFIRGIHNLSEREAENYEGQLPLNMKCLDNFLEWQRFLEAIREFENLEKNSKLKIEDDDATSSPPPGRINIPWSVSMTNLIPDTDTPEHSPSNSPELLKYPYNGNDVDKNIKTTNHELSNTPLRPVDGLSCFTIGGASDFQKSESQEPNQSAFRDNQITADSPTSQGATNHNSNHGTVHEAGHDVYNGAGPLHGLNQIIPDRNLSPKIGMPAHPPLIIPPPRNINLPSTDTMSNVISNFNDSASTWSKQTGLAAIHEKESRGESSKPSVSVNQPKTVKPPRQCISTDNISARLEAFNVGDLQENDVNEISV